MPESPSELARAAVDAFNQSDWERAESLLTPDAVYDEVGTGRRAEGREEIIELLKGWKQTMPDANGTVSSAIESGNQALLEITWEGTMTGPWGDTPGTGRHQSTRAAWLLTFSGDAISESRQYFDSMTLMQQLGLLPQPAGVA